MPFGRPPTAKGEPGAGAKRSGAADASPPKAAATKGATAQAKIRITQPLLFMTISSVPILAR